MYPNREKVLIHLEKSLSKYVAKRNVTSLVFGQTAGAAVGDKKEITFDTRPRKGLEDWC